MRPSFCACGGLNWWQLEPGRFNLFDVDIRRGSVGAFMQKIIVLTKLGEKPILTGARCCILDDEGR
jgi:hypothetical protein